MTDPKTWEARGECELLIPIDGGFFNYALPDRETRDFILKMAHSWDDLIYACKFVNARLKGPDVFYEMNPAALIELMERALKLAGEK